MIDRQELRKKLPRGYGKKIALRIGVSEQSVSRYFSYRQNSERVENAVLDILVELSDEKRRKLGSIL